MSIFGDAFHAITNVVSHVLPAPIKKIIQPVVNIGTAVTKLQPKGLLSVAAKGPVLGPISFATQNIAPKYSPVVNTVSTVGAAIPTGGSTMGLNLGGLLSGAVSGISTLFSGGTAAQAVQNFGSSFLPTVTSNTGAAIPSNPYSQQLGYAQPVMATVPAAARAVATVGRSFFAKYPNLATYIQNYRNMGKNVTRAKLYSLLKRFGPELLISGGLLSAAAINELMVAGPGRRRMNPGNASALRRSLRRLESFHRLCQRADKFRRPRGRGSKSKGGCATQFVRQG